MTATNAVKCYLCGNPIKEPGNKEYIPATPHTNRAVHRDCKQKARK